MPTPIYIWVKFPRTEEDTAWFPDPLPPCIKDETRVTIKIDLNSPNKEGPTVSQIGSLLDVISSMLKDSKVSAAYLLAEWQDEKEL